MFGYFCEEKKHKIKHANHFLTYYGESCMHTDKFTPYYFLFHYLTLSTLYC